MRAPPDSKKAIPLDNFQALGLSEPLLQAITETGYVTPTPIQLQAIPAVLAGGDVLGIAQTGTGKTAAFALPILHRLAADRKPTPRRGVRALILSPTRELASQIADSFKVYGKHLGFSVAVVFGGVSERPQAEKLNRGIDILVATPGRLLDHMGQRNVSLGQTEIFVLDEADQMLDLGFFKPIRRVVADLPKVRQSLFFSATMPKEIEELTRELLTNPTKVQVAPASTTVERVTQRVIRVEQSKKKALLAELLSGDGMHRTLVFTRTKRGADRVAKHLTGAKISAAAIHGNKSQNQREAALHAFKKGDTQVLVATDIAARGIDIDEVTHVVNYELPEVPEAYVHRIGRTARAGASGSAISFCDEGERHLLRDIERVTRQVIDSEDRRNDKSLEADKQTGKGARETGEPQDGESPSVARREFKRQAGRSEGRFDRAGRRAGGAGGDRTERPKRAPSGDRSARPERADRPERRDGERAPWQLRNREGSAPRGDRPAGERSSGERSSGPRPERSPSERSFGSPRREREGGDGVWTNDGSRPNREHRNASGRSESGRPASGRPETGSRPASREGRSFGGERSAGGGDRPSFRGGDRRPDREGREGRPERGEARGALEARPEGRREDRPHAPRGDRPGADGERRPRSFDGPRGGDRPHTPRGSDRSAAPRGEGRPYQARSERPDGERREWKPRPPRDDSRGEGRGPRPEGQRFEGRRPEGAGERSGPPRSNAGPRRDDQRREGRPGGDKPRFGGGRSEGSGFGGAKRPSGPPREGGFRKPSGGGAFRGRDGGARPPRRDAE